MPASQFPLSPDLQEATELGLLSLAEAWQLMDEWLIYPEARFPVEMHPLLARLSMLDWRPAEMTRQ